MHFLLLHSLFTLYNMFYYFHLCFEVLLNTYQLIFHFANHKFIYPNATFNMNNKKTINIIGFKISVKNSKCKKI